MATPGAPPADTPPTGTSHRTETRDHDRPPVSVAQALARVLATVAPLHEAESVPLRAALGRTLAEDTTAPHDVPPFANSAMDGYAVRAADVRAASRAVPARLRVIGRVTTGVVAGRALESGQAYRILTGAPLPPGADAVVPYELTDGQGFGGWIADPGQALAETGVMVYEPVTLGEHTRAAGEDQRRGDVVLRRGAVLRPAEVGVLATLGCAHVRVVRRPRVAILSTGDELLPVGTPLAPGRIYDANGESLAALVEWYGGHPIPLGIARDDAGAVRERLRAAIAGGADLIVTSGGVSVGERDVVKLVLSEDGAIDFWSVAMRPGRPLTLGHVGGVPVLALPGNPVSAMVAFELFVRPALLSLAGRHALGKTEIVATALEPLRAARGLETFLRGVVTPSGDGAGRAWTVRTTGGQGSGMLGSMARANALIHLTREDGDVPSGGAVRAIMLDWPALA